MKPVLLLLLATFLIPWAAAAEPTEAYAVRGLRAQASNQRVDLFWEPPIGPNGTQGPTVVGYTVYVFASPEAGDPYQVNATRHSFFLVNGRTYTFQVAARLSDGTEGPRSGPVAATPLLERDLAYLAAGLIVTWLAILGYVGLLVRREARLDRKLEQLLAHRGGRSP